MPTSPVRPSCPLRRPDGCSQLANASAARDEAIYKRLLDLLETSTSYRPDRVLGRLPSEDMHEARAILLGRLGRHEGALQIYVYQLEDHATAEQCVRSPPTFRFCSFLTEFARSMLAQVLQASVRLGSDPTL